MVLSENPVLFNKDVIDPKIIEGLNLRLVEAWIKTNRNVNVFFRKDNKSSCFGCTHFLSNMENTTVYFYGFMDIDVMHNKFEALIAFLKGEEIDFEGIEKMGY